VMSGVPHRKSLDCPTQFGGSFTATVLRRIHIPFSGFARSCFRQSEMPSIQLALRSAHCGVAWLQNASPQADRAFGKRDVVRDGIQVPEGFDKISRSQDSAPGRSQSRRHTE